MLLFVFESTHDALSAEQILESKGLKIRILPTPRVFSSSCGLSIRVTHGDGEEIKKLLVSNGIVNCKYAIGKEVDGRVSYSELV